MKNLTIILYFLFFSFFSYSEPYLVEENSSSSISVENKKQRPPPGDIFIRAQQIFTSMIGMQVKEDDFRFKSFMDVENLTYKNKRLIQILNSTDCKRVTGKAYIFYFSWATKKEHLERNFGFKQHIIPVDLQFVRNFGHYKQYKMKFIKADYKKDSPWSPFRPRWIFEYKRPVIEAQTFVFFPPIAMRAQLRKTSYSRVKSSSVIVSFKMSDKETYYVNLERMKLVKSVYTKNGDTSLNCELKQVVSNVSY